MTATRRDLIQQFVPHSPLVGHLGIELTSIEPDRAELRMAFRPELATMGDVVHGGAIATLIDTAGMVAAWSDDAVPEAPAGSTIALAVSFVAAARGCDVLADARVVRRGRTLCFVDVVARGLRDAVIATGQVTHRYG